MKVTQDVYHPKMWKFDNCAGLRLDFDVFWYATVAYLI